MPFVTIENLLIFAPNIGVLVQRAALESSPERLFEAVRIAYSHMEDEPLVDACCGGSGPLADYDEIPYANYLELLNKIRVDQAGQTAKKAHTKTRRTQFNANRDALVLAMIEAGVTYVCAEKDCGVHKGLTVDHIVPLSRGGTDELSNLRFLCRTHNSAKRDSYHG